MHIDHLVKMANQIGGFFEAMPDREEGMAGVMRAMRTIVGAGRSAGMARARTHERDQTRDDGAEQRQESDRVVHAPVSPSSG